MKFEILKCYALLNQQALKYHIAILMELVYYHHIKSMAKACILPVIIHSVPPRWLG